MSERCPALNPKHFKTRTGLRNALAQALPQIWAVIAGFEGRDLSKAPKIKTMLRLIPNSRSIKASCHQWTNRSDVKITFSVGVYAPLADVIETAIHEVCHIFDDGKAQAAKASDLASVLSRPKAWALATHDDAFNVRLSRAVEEIYGLKTQPAKYAKSAEVYTYDKRLQMLIGALVPGSLDLARENQIERLVKAGFEEKDLKTLAIAPPMAIVWIDGKGEKFQVRAIGRPVGMAR